MRIAMTQDRRLVLLDSARAWELDSGGRDLGVLLREGCDVGALARREVEGFAEDRFAAPLLPGKIVAIGLNYHDHAQEAGLAPPEKPLVFSKFPSSVIGPRDPIVIDPDLTTQVDWEAELAVVVGRPMRRVRSEQALDYVFGYTVANDVSARDAQLGDGQWVRGKSFDTFCPLGPWIVTADEIGDPQDLTVSARVNDEVVQHASTAAMVFPVAELLAYCSHSFTLDPGDIVLTGTPSGVGMARKPPRWLQPGDVLHTEIEGIGTLINPVTLGTVGAGSITPN